MHASSPAQISFLDSIASSKLNPISHFFKRLDSPPARWDRTRDRACDRNVIRAFCNKTLDQLLGTSSSEPANSKSLLHFRSIQVLGISGWIAIESEDQDGLKRFSNELSLRRLHPVELDYSTIEYVVLVNTN